MSYSSPFKRSLQFLGKASFPKVLKEMMLNNFLVTKFCTVWISSMTSLQTQSNINC